MQKASETHIRFYGHVQIAVCCSLLEIMHATALRAIVVVVAVVYSECAVLSAPAPTSSERILIT